MEMAIPDKQLEQMQRAVDAQLAAAWSRTDVFERRAATVLSALGVVLTVLFSVLSLVDLGDLRLWSRVSASIAVLLLLSAGAYCLAVMKPRDVNVVANDRLQKLWEKQVRNPGHENLQIQAQILHDIILPSGDSKSVLASATEEAESRGESLLAGMRLFAGGVSMLALTVIQVLWVKI